MAKERLLKALRNDTYCRIKRSRLHGVGVFAIKPVPKGENPFKGCTNDDWVGLTEKELATLPPAVKKMIADFFSKQDGKIWVPAHCLNGNDISFFLNTSKKPNVIPVGDGTFFKTLRAIRTGEELTVDYSKFDENY